jgi:hypothetical protein
MPTKRVAHKEKMTKKKSGSMATKWVPSEFEESNLNKARREGFLAGEAPIIFPGTERIPKPPSGCQVMFLAFLLCGLSLPAHEFLRGLLFVYGVQLHQLTLNLILHIACFITMCESFLGIDPHWILWKFLFHLRPSVSLAKNPELGGAIVSVRAESHYLEFNMAVSVQGWRKKWFYIKDQKTASSDNFGIAPFDAKKSLTKLTLWDSPPTEAEVKNINPLLTCSQSLKSAVGGGLTGTQLMAFFLQRRIQPLQAHVSKLWSYSGSDDSSQVSNQDPEKKELDKRVRSLTTVTKEKEIPALTADFFDSSHPLPKVCALQLESIDFYLLCSFYLNVISLMLFCECLYAGSSIFGFSSSSSRGRADSG